MTVATVTSKGQVTIPKDVRDRLGIHPGDQLEFMENERGFVVQKRVAASPFVKYVGFLHDLEGRDPDDVVEEMRGR
jgi:antitoxin PrlF